jgi:hypothetical protein
LQHARPGGAEGLGNPLSANNEAIRCGSNVVKGITGDKGENLVSVRIQHAHFIGIYYFCRNNTVRIASRRRYQANKVVCPDIPQWAEKGIPVRGDSHVADLARQRGSGNVSGGAMQGGFIGPSTTATDTPSRSTSIRPIKPPGATFRRDTETCVPWLCDWRSSRSSSRFARRSKIHESANMNPQ